VVGEDADAIAGLERAVRQHARDGVFLGQPLDRDRRLWCVRVESGYTSP
jgi:hypothetical protein